MQRNMDDPTASVTRSSHRRLRGLDWTIIVVGLGLAVLLLVGGLLPARERSRRLDRRNQDLAEEILKTREGNQELLKTIQDLHYDPQTLERILREKGGLREGEERVRE